MRKSFPCCESKPGSKTKSRLLLREGLDVVAISLWDSKEHAEAYSTTGYPEVLKTLDQVLDGTPKVRISDVISSTIHKALVASA
jgi:hypothetical protein